MGMFVLSPNTLRTSGFLCQKPGVRPFMSPFPPPRCRKCSACLSYRRWIWISRIKAEIANHEKSWFMTFTHAPDGDVNWKDGYDLVQKYLKRLRKRHRVRYLCVAERGTHGTKRIHYHMVLHGDNKLTYKAARQVWHLSDGISHARLCQKRDVEYVAKYATKDDQPVRPSNAYGRANNGRIASEHPIIREIFKRFPNARMAGMKHDGTPLPRAIVKKIDIDLKKALRLDGTCIQNVFPENDTSTLREPEGAAARPPPIKRGGILFAKSEERFQQSEPTKGDPTCL